MLTPIHVVAATVIAAVLPPAAYFFQRWRLRRADRAAVIEAARRRGWIVVDIAPATGFYCRRWNIKASRDSETRQFRLEVVGGAPWRPREAQWAVGSDH